MEQTSFLDYLNLGDSGTDDPDSIQPMANGESASQTVLGRPQENLRSRTEILRDTARAAYYYRDFNHLVIEGATSHTIGWGGAVDLGGTGILTQVGALTIRPILTPALSQHGVLKIPNPGVNEVRYSVTSSGYASRGQDAIYVEHRDVAASTLACTISAGPVKRVLLVFDAANVAHTTTAAVGVINAAIAADPDLGAGTGAPYLQASTLHAGVQPMSAQASTHLAGTADQEAHVLASGILTTLTTTSPLANGDAVAIWYDKLVEEPPGILAPGGRWESNPDRGTSTVPLGSLFVTSNNPEKIPGAVPLCKVVNNELVWFTGDRFQVGMVGPIGSLSAASAVVNFSTFSGAPSNANNGGISNPLVPATVQAALNVIDTRLASLRTCWTCTDGSTTVGGHYNGTTAIQDAIAVLGTNGTLLVRKGTYTIPNTYAIPAGITFLADGPVTIQQAAPVSLSIGSGTSFIGYFTLNVGSTQITTSSFVYMDNVAVLGRLQCGDNFKADTLVVNGTASAAAYSVSFTGVNANVQKLIANHSVTVGGINNRIALLNVTGTAATLASSCVKVNGINCTIDTVTYVATSDLSVGVALLEVGGSDNAVSGALANTTASAISNGRYGLWLNACLNAGIRSLDFAMASGTPLKVTGAVSVHGALCKLSNTTGTDSVIDTTAISGFQRWSWDRCNFSQNTNTSSTLMDVIPDLTQTRILFNTCRFEGAKLSGFALRAQGCKFDNCTFAIINPVVAGAPRLGGVTNGQTDTLFRFMDDCVAEDCVIDCNDAEVNNNAGSPDISVPLFVEVTRSEARNLTLININQQMASTQPYASLINLGSLGKIRRFSIKFTATASVQGGTQSLTSVVAINTGDSYCSDFIMPTVNYPGTAGKAQAFAVGPASSGAAKRFIAERIKLLTAFTGVCATNLGSSLSLSESVFRDCQFGTSAAGCVTPVGIPLPAGSTNYYDRCRFYHAGTAGTGVFTILDGSPDDHTFDKCTLGNVAATDGAVGVFSGTGANAATNFKFIGCRIKITGTGAGPMPFHTAITMAAATNSGAGNTFTFSSGTTTAPTFSAVVNIWT